MAEKSHGDDICEQAEKLWGNSQVLCGGRFVAGPDGKASAFTLIMVVVPAVAWQVLVGAWFSERYGVSCAFFGAVMTCASLVLLCATAFSDPGIVPRQQDFQEQFDVATSASRVKQPSRQYDIVLRGHPFKLKYCVTCNIYRPPRCTHCSVCENCVERFDHHCPWIGNCVGKRNYWLFFSFVTATGTLNAFSLATASALLAIRGQEICAEQGLNSSGAFVETVKQEPLTAALLVYCALLVWFTVGLCLYHSYLISTNQTTYEQIKGFYSEGTNPFLRGTICGNWFDVVCTPVRPRYFDGATGQPAWPKALLDASSDRLTRLPFGTAAKPALRGAPAPLADVPPALFAGSPGEGAGAAAAAPAGEPGRRGPPPQRTPPPQLAALAGSESPGWRPEAAKAPRPHAASPAGDPGGARPAAGPAARPAGGAGGAGGPGGGGQGQR